MLVRREDEDHFRITQKPGGHWVAQDKVSRGIGLETIREAEDAEFLRHTGGAVFFVGYDAAGQARNVTRWATDLDDPIPKLDLAGSDKCFPSIVPRGAGEEPE